MFRHSHLAALAVLVSLSAPAFATAEHVVLNDTDCYPSLSTCAHQTVDVTTPKALAIGGGYSFVMYSNGGIASASVGFAPGAGALLTGQDIIHSDALFTYTFQVEGKANTIVPLHVGANLARTTVTASSDAFKISDGESISIKQNGNGLLSSSAGATLDPRCFTCVFDYGPQETAIDQFIPVLSNTDIMVELYAGTDLTFTQLGYSDPQFAAVAASADPVFTIDDPAYSDFRIVGVPQEAQSAVPEPASWALLIAGLLLIGAMFRYARGQGRRGSSFDLSAG